MGFALPPSYLNATKYTGDQISDVPCVDRTRAPTTTDVNYPILTLWRNGDPNAIFPDVYGDLWYLAYFIGQTGTSNLAHWVKFDTGGGGGGVANFQVQAATLPGVTTVLPDAGGTVFINGGSVANHLVPVESHSRNINTYNIEVQYADSNTIAQANKSGIAHFDSSSFTVDPTTGFVRLAGGVGPAIDSITVDAFTAPGTQPVVPNGTGIITVTGGQVATGTIGANVIRTNSLAANTYTTQIQQTATSAAKNTALNGVSHFKSTDFTVDEGFVSLSTSVPFISTGTFVPVLSFGGGSTGLTYSTRNGKFVKIGSLVYYDCGAQLSNKGSSTGAATVTGLPFPVIPAADGVINFEMANIPSTIYTVYTIAFLPTTLELISKDNSTTPITSTSVTEAYFNNNTQFHCWGFYTTA